MNISTYLLQQGESGGATTLIMMGAILVVMYFFMIRPQQKKMKEAKKFREELEKGQKVITAGGIHGKILEINETSILIQSEGSTKLRVEKSSIVLSPEESPLNQNK